MQTSVLSERQKRILHVLRAKQSVSLKELSFQLHESDSTLRRELRTLADSGLVVRQAGKVQLAFAAGVETPFLLRMAINEDEKLRIAAAALELVQNGDTIFISGGTTTLNFARLLPGRKRVTVITNAIPVINAVIGMRDIKLVVLGGEVQPGEQTMHGHLTLYSIEQLRADKLFFGIEAISLEHGLTHNQLVEVSTDRALINASTQTILLADHTKFGKVAPALVVPIQQVHLIVTGRELPQEIAGELASLNVKVVLA